MMLSPSVVSYFADLLRTREWRLPKLTATPLLASWLVWHRASVTAPASGDREGSK